MDITATVWTLLPPIIAIALALITKEVYSSLLIGILAGALLYTGFKPLHAVETTFEIMGGKLGDNINIWSGNDDQTLPMLALGAKGLISVTSNLLPAPMAELTHSYFRGEAEQAKELQMAYLPLMKALFAQVNPIPIKAAMEELGLDSGCLRRPLWTMDPKPRKALRETLHAFALLP